VRARHQQATPRRRHLTKRVTRMANWGAILGGALVVWIPIGARLGGMIGSPTQVPTQQHLMALFQEEGSGTEAARVRRDDSSGNARAKPTAASMACHRARATRRRNHRGPHRERRERQAAQPFRPMRTKPRHPATRQPGLWGGYSNDLPYSIFFKTCAKDSSAQASRARSVCQSRAPQNGGEAGAALHDPHPAARGAPAKG